MRRLMDGETVSISARVVTGTDALGQPTYEWADPVGVPALVSERTSSDRSGQRPEGIESRITMALPRTCDLDLRGARVEWRGRTYVVEGDPCHVASPLDSWDMNVTAVRVDG